MNHPTLQTQQNIPITPEDIWVVPTAKVFFHGAWQGIKSIDQSYIDYLVSHKEFHPRALMETDVTYKQIIPYLIFCHENTYFLMQRKNTASEQRLKNKFTLGIGGHVRAQDIQGSHIFDWAKREFQEEVNYHGSLSIALLGALNDDSNDVGKVHLGIVLLLQGETPTISIRSELKNGVLVDLDQCGIHYESMESWSQMVYSFLLKSQQ